MSKATITAKVLTKDSALAPQPSTVNFSNKIRIQLSTNSKFPRKPYTITTEPLQINEYGFVKTTIDNLTPDTKYFVRLISEDRTNTDYAWVGEFKTPKTTSHSFNFGIGACNSGHVQSKVWNRLAEIATNNEIDFYYQIGDWFYNPIVSNNISEYYKRYDSCLFGSTLPAESPTESQLTHRKLWNKVPVYYQWDDHDYALDNADQFYLSKSAGLTAYRQYIPGPTLANLGTTAGVYYSWTRGRVRFVATDVRSERTIDNTTGRPNNSARYIFHPDQEQWFKDQITAAAGLSQAVIWVCTNPWVGPGAATGAPTDIRGNNISRDWRTAREWNSYRGLSLAAWQSESIVELTSGVTYDFVGGVTGTSSKSVVDHWGTRQLQRDRIADHITQQGMNDRVIIISGDMHGFAFDDGYLHTATGGFKFSGGGQKIKNPNNAGTLKVCHTAPLYRNDGDPVTFFQDPWCTTEVDKYYSARNQGLHGTWGATGFAAFNANSSYYTEGSENDSRGGPYYIGPISVGGSPVAVPAADWGTPGTTGDILPTYYFNPDASELTPPPTPVITSGYSIMNVTDFGGNTMGFRFRAVLTYPWSSSAGATVGPFDSGCPGTTCPEKTIIDQTWTVNIT